MKRPLPTPLLALLLPLLLAVVGCDLQPKSVPCSNAGDCQAVSQRFGYCAQSRCVECLEDSGCGDGNRCKAGMCERRCKSEKDCPRGEACHEGICGG